MITHGRIESIKRLRDGAKTDGERSAAELALARVLNRPRNAAAQELGRKGGLARVPKGFAMMDYGRLSRIAQKGGRNAAKKRANGST